MQACLGVLLPFSSLGSRAGVQGCLSHPGPTVEGLGEERAWAADGSLLCVVCACQVFGSVG